ncbi:1935_t:CDS:2, partial [Funneliformis mosseae]
DNYENVDKLAALFSFYKTLNSINEDDNMSQETDILQANNSIWSPSPPTSSSSNNEKREAQQI